MGRKLLWYCWFLLMCNIVFAQYKLIPNSPTQISTASKYYNFSTIQDSIRFNASLSYQSHLGILKHISNVWFDASLYSRNYKSEFLVLVSNEKENGFVDRLRIYTGYGYVIKLNDNWTAKSNMAVGMFNYNIRSSTNSVGVSKIVPDALVGSSFQNQKFMIGISAFQLFSTNFTLISTSHKLKRYVVFNSHYKFLKGLNEFKIFANVPVGNPNYILLSGVNYKLGKYISFGSYVQYPRILAFDMQLNLLSYEKLKNLKLELTYGLPITNEYINMGNSLSVGLQILN